MQKDERIRDFNIRVFKTLNLIPEEQNPNASVILRCYKNVMPSNVKFSIRVAQIKYLNGYMHKVTELE